MNRMGINEDPVTGSAHCVLVPYWMHKLNAWAEQPLTAFQASERGGLLRVALVRSSSNSSISTSRGETVPMVDDHRDVTAQQTAASADRVLMIGEAKTVLSCKLYAHVE